MSTPSKRLHPAWLAGILVLLLVLVVFAVSQSGSAPEDENEGSTAGSGKATGGPSSKSGGHRDRLSSAPPSVASKSERVQDDLMVLVQEARDELKAAGGAVGGVLANSEARTKMMEDLRKTSDPAEQQRIRQEYHDQYNRSPASPGQPKTVEDRRREARLRTITFLPGMARAAQQYAQDDRLAAEAISFQENLLEFAQKAPDMDDETFRAAYKSIRTEANDLRNRSVELRKEDHAGRAGAATP